MSESQKIKNCKVDVAGISQHVGAILDAHDSSAKIVINGGTNYTSVSWKDFRPGRDIRDSVAALATEACLD